MRIENQSALRLKCCVQINRDNFWKMARGTKQTKIPSGPAEPKEANGRFVYSSADDQSQGNMRYQLIHHGACVRLLILIPTSLFSSFTKMQIHHRHRFSA
ncbi:hypothetical protein [Pararhizobium sp. IMCC21322]|uniref:hypothetical protein n=1 Tax=Pararhizobium sp. IMCC21322 TaxID=3067903 RepID=UPI0027410B9E|nr:hypothetical protein [Pararhizobium sp. IMCC21322]